MERLLCCVKYRDILEGRCGIYLARTIIAYSGYDDQCLDILDSLLE